MLDLAKLTASPPDREPISHAEMLDQLQDEMDAFVARCEAEERAEALDALDAARAALRAATVRAVRLTADG